MRINYNSDNKHTTTKYNDDWPATTSTHRNGAATATAAMPASGKFIFSCFFFGSTNNFFLQLDYVRMNYNGDNEHTPRPKITMNGHATISTH
jgi:hypothetical protein